MFQWIKVVLLCAVVVVVENTNAWNIFGCSTLDCQGCTQYNLFDLPGNASCSGPHNSGFHIKITSLTASTVNVILYTDAACTTPYGGSGNIDNLEIKNPRGACNVVSGSASFYANGTLVNQYSTSLAGGDGNDETNATKVDKWDLYSCGSQDCYPHPEANQGCARYNFTPLPRNATCDGPHIAGYYVKLQNDGSKFENVTFYDDSSCTVIAGSSSLILVNLEVKNPRGKCFTGVGPGSFFANATSLTLTTAPTTTTTKSDGPCNGMNIMQLLGLMVVVMGMMV
jgi:hypothetical protein